MEFWTLLARNLYKDLFEDNMRPRLDVSVTDLEKLSQRWQRK
jgi:hypothetical protein